MSDLANKLDEITNFVDDNLVDVYFNDYEDRPADTVTFVNCDISLAGATRQKTILQHQKKAIFEQDLKVTFYIYNSKKTSTKNIFEKVDTINGLLTKRSLYPSGLMLTNKITTPNATIDNSLGDNFNNYIIECFFKFSYQEQIS